MMSLRPVRRKTVPANLSADYEIEVDIGESSTRGGGKWKTQKENSEKPKKKSKIWSYFNLVVNNKYECVLCSGRLNYVGDSTSNFYRHMRTKHPSESSSSPPRKRKRKGFNDRYDDNDSIIPCSDECVDQHDKLGELRERSEVLQERLGEQQDRSGEQKERLGEQERSEEQQEGLEEHHEMSKKQQEKSEDHQEKSEEQPKVPSKRSSQMWNYFKLVSKNKYQCILCSRKLNHAGGSTANFYRHMRYRHPLEPLSVYKKSKEDIIVEFCEGSGPDEGDGDNERPKEAAASSHVDDSSYDASQPWRFFDISTGNATCRLCFRSLIYNSIDDLAVLLDHLRSKHSISLRKHDSADVAAEFVENEKGCESRRSTVSSNGAENLGGKFGKYFTNFNDHSATCKMCSSPVSYNRKTLISHLYKEHKSVFSKKYPTFWHFSKFFSSNSLRTLPSKENSTSSEQISTGCDEGEISRSSEKTEPSVKRMSYSQNIVANFLNLDGNKAKCMFCSKSLSFSGDVSILEQHILKDHKKVFIQKILEEMVFTNTNTSGKSTNKLAIDKNTRNEKHYLLREDILSYYEPLGNRHFECKICSKLLSLENEESFNQLAEHVWCAHMSKIFQSIVFLQSFGISGTNLEESNTNNETLENKKMLHSTRLGSIKWVKPVGKLSKAWKYFLTPDPELDLPYAKCRLCNHVLSIKSANISNLSRHLNNRHSDVLQRNLNMFYENGRMFSKNSKRKIARTYMVKELCKSGNYAPKVLSTKISSVKCRLCGEYLPYSDRETCGKHMKEKHFDTYNMGVTFEKYKKNEMNILTVNDEMDVTESSSKTNEIVVKDDDCHVSTFFVKSGSSYTKCKVCRKFISRSIVCRHRVPMIFSLSFGVKSLKKSEKLLTAGRKSGKISSRIIYCSSLNMVKNYCDICLKNPMSLLCRCIVNRRFVLPKLMNSTQNENCLSTQYLQDLPKSERQVYAVLFSINYFEKSCCLLCNEKVSQGKTLLPCFDHFWLKHGTLVKSFSKLSRSVGRRKLIDNIEFESYFDTPLGLMGSRERRCSIVETNVESEQQPTMILNFVCDNQPLENENTVSCFEVNTGDSIASFNISENPSTSFDFNNGNPSLIVVGENQTLSFVGNHTDVVDTETHSSVLAITGAERVASEVEVIPENLEASDGKRRNASLVWNFFTKVGSNTAYCNACGRIAKMSTLNNLKRHLKCKHPRLAQLLKQEKMKRFLSESSNITENELSDKWMYYKKLNDDWAECNNCKRYISIRGGCTANLARHLRSKKCINKESDKELLCRLTNEPSETRRKTSSVWHYFQRQSADKAQCSMCQHVISIKNNNISNLSRHLRTVHRVYIIPSSNFNPQVIDLQAVPDNSATVKYKYVVDEELNISEVTNNDSQTFIKTAIVESGVNSDENFLLEETFPSYIAEEVVGVLDPIQTNDSIDQDTTDISLDTLLKKIYRSPSWNYFTKLPNAKVKCKLCDVSLAFKSSKCINNLTRHLKKKHGSVIASTYSETDNEKCIIFVHDANEAEPTVKKMIRKGRTSYLWNYFVRSENRKVVTCRICQKDLSYKSSPISNLRRHLEVKHSNVLDDMKIGSLEEPNIL